MHLRLTLFAFLVACAPKLPLPEPVHGGAWPIAKKALRHETIAVAKPVLASELPATPLPDEPPPDAVSVLVEDVADNLPEPTRLDPKDPRDASFLRNEWAGNVRFGGGFVRLGSIGVEVRARLVELGQDPEYQTQGKTWLGRLVSEKLADKKIVTLSVDPLTDLAPLREKTRGRHPDDGHDNLNVPRTTLAPPSLTPDQRTTAKQRSEGHRWLLVPILRNYYTHNAGWFLGQDYGSMSGGRTEVLLTLYDLDTGEPAWWMSTEAKTIERTASPSRTDLDTYLLTVEQMTAKQFDKRLFK